MGELLRIGIRAAHVGVKPQAATWELTKTGPPRTFAERLIRRSQP